MKRSEYIAGVKARLKAEGRMSEGMATYGAVFDILTTPDRELDAWRQVDETLSPLDGSPYVSVEIDPPPKPPLKIRKKPGRKPKEKPQPPEPKVITPADLGEEGSGERRNGRKQRLIPKKWGTLPEKASRCAEVEWVHQNWYRCSVKDPTSGVKAGVKVLRMARAATVAPSWGAVGMLEVAFLNSQKFEAEIYNREMKNATEEDEAQVHEERMALVECGQIIRQMQERIKA